MKPFYLLFLISSFCFAQDEKEAEGYYKQAKQLLEHTTQNDNPPTLAREALRYANLAVELDPKKPEYFRTKAASHLRLREYDKALTNFNKTLKMDSTNIEAWTGKAIAYEEKNEFILAEKNYKSGLKLATDSKRQNAIAFVCYNFAIFYEKWKKPNDAAKYYTLTLAADSTYTKAYKFRGCIKINQKKYTEALSDFNAFISIDSLNKSAYNNRGLCKFYLKDYTAAIADFEKAITLKADISPGEKDEPGIFAFNNLANCYFALGNIDKACENWNTAIQKGYKYQKEWKEMYNVEDPKVLIKRNCIKK